MFGHHRLHEQRALLGIDSGADPIGDVVDGGRHDFCGVREAARQRMPVGDEVEALVLALKCYPVLESADEMSDVKLSGWAHARHDSLAHHRSESIRKCSSGRTIAPSTPEISSR